MDKDILLRVEHLSKEFPVRGNMRGNVKGKRASLKAVQDVSFSLKEGETLGIVGESGCGKSTLGRLILRLIEPTAGKVFLREEELTALSQRELRKKRKDFQMIFQDSYASFDPRKTIRNILEEPLSTHGIPKEKWKSSIEEILSATGLSKDALKRYPHEFSGGQRQRIGIARALILNPKMVIADEPVAALDVSIQAQILNLLMDLQKQFGLSMIFIAHNLATVQYISRRIIVMYLGHVMEIADSDGLYEHPMHPYTQALISSIPIPDPECRKELRGIEGEIPSPVNPPGGCVFQTRCPHAEIQCAEMVPVLREIEAGHFVACDRVENRRNI